MQATKYQQMLCMYLCLNVWMCVDREVKTGLYVCFNQTKKEKKERLRRKQTKDTKLLWMQNWLKPRIWTKTDKKLNFLMKQK